MANITTHAIATPLRDGWDRVTETLARWFEARLNIASRRDQIVALETKTDAELSQLGIRRDEIALHVFRDKFYT